MMDMELLNSLMKAKSYRGFMGEYFKVKKKKNKNFSYAYFARIAGFSSKSFARDIVIGKKRITAKTLPKFINAFKLKGHAAKLFKLLVIQEENDLNFKTLSVTEIKNKIKETTIKLELKISGFQNGLDANIFAHADFPTIFASLGSSELGSTIEQIFARSSIGINKCNLILSKLIKSNLVKYNIETKTYHALNPHLIFNNIKKNEFFITHFLKSLDLAKKNAKENFDSNENLFFNSTFSIQKSKIPELTKKLNNLLIDYVDMNESSEGDAVVTLTTALF